MLRYRELLSIAIIEFTGSRQYQQGLAEGPGQRLLQLLDSYQPDEVRMRQLSHATVACGYGLTLGSFCG